MLVPSIFEHGFNDDFFDDFMAPFDFTRTGSRQMKMKSDLKEFDDKYELNLQLPGFKKEDVKAELKNGYLTISASHEEKKDEKKEGKYVWKETYSGQYTRSFYVGKDVKQEDIKAKFANGELRVDIPKVESKPEVEGGKYISIEG